MRRVKLPEEGARGQQGEAAPIRQAGGPGAGAEPQRGRGAPVGHDAGPATSSSTLRALEGDGRGRPSLLSRRGPDGSSSIEAARAAPMAAAQCGTAAASTPEALALNGDASALGLVQQSTTEDSAESLGNRLAQVDANLAEWRAALASKLRRRAHARRIAGRCDLWWKQRARALERGWSVRASGCGEERTLVLTCRGCGTVRERPVPCALRHWCPACAEHRRRREYRRLVPALTQRAAEERRAWYRAGRGWKGAPQLRLLTLTATTQATVEETRAVIAKAWPRWRRWLWDEIGYAPPFAATWEITDGPAGAHPHLHVCIVLPFISLPAAAAAWSRATGGRAEAQGLDLRTVNSRKAARYVAAYVTASTLDESLSVETAAAWVRATYAKRLVTASRGFWLAPERRERCDCGSCDPLAVAIERAPEGAGTPRGPP